MLLIERCEQGQRLARRDLVLERGGLERGADSLLDLEGMLARVDAADLDAARVRFAQSDDAFERRRLAGAVRADQAEDLAVLDVEADAARRLDAVISFSQIPTLTFADMHG